MMKSRAYYERRFSAYPDVVTIPVFRKMMGNIAYSNVTYLLEHDLVKHLNGWHATYIPKEYIIDYLVSDHYQTFKLSLKHPV
jgi:hypothetical protein